MAEGDIPEPNEAQAREAQALVGILGALSGLQTLPLVNSDSDPVPLMPIEEAVSLLGGAEHLPGPVRLELLARLAHAREQDHAGLAAADLDLGSVARQLMKPGTDAGLSNEVMLRLAHWVPGTEPFGRMSVADFENFSFGKQLQDDIACTAMVVKPGCGAVTTSVHGIQALSIVTDVYSCKKFDEFESLVEPTQWPQCWLERLFFRSMKPTPGSVAEPLDVPDGVGWHQSLTEVVDWALGTSGNDSQCMTTELDVTYFWNASSPAVASAVTGTSAGAPGELPSVSYAPGVPGAGFTPNTAVPPVVTRSPVAVGGCTYDLKSSVNNQILVDQGFLLVEEIPGSDLRHYRTQKEVCFASGNLPPTSVCSFWSLASGLIMQGC